MENRNRNIDVYRCLLMLEICLLHSITQGGYVIRGLDNLLSPSVIGFFVISGWFGIRFKPSRAFRLVAIALIYAIFSTIVGCCIGYETKGVLSVLRGYWFVWAYLVVVLFSSLVQKCVEAIGSSKKETLTVLIPIILCVFIWGYCAKIPMLCNVIPADSSFSPFSALTFIGAYSCVRICRASGIFDALPRKYLWTAMIGSSLFVYGGLYHHNSPFAFLFAVSSFLLFADVRLPVPLKRCASYIAPSVFAIYLYHSTDIGFRIIGILERYFVDNVGLPIVVNHFVTGILVFVCGLLIDSPRRLMCFVLHARLRAFYNVVDTGLK